MEVSGPIGSIGLPSVVGLPSVSLPAHVSAASCGPEANCAPTFSGIPGIVVGVSVPPLLATAVPVVAGPSSMMTAKNCNQGFKYSRFQGKSEEGPHSHVRSFEKRYVLLDGNLDPVHKEAVF